MAPTTRLQSKSEGKEGDEMTPKLKPEPRRGRESGVEEPTLGAVLPTVALGLLGAVVFMGLWSWLVFTDKVSLSGPVKAEKLATFGPKLEFTFRYQILGVIWLVISMISVAVKRVVNPAALDPMSGNEYLVQDNKNILTNSLEQFVVSAAVQVGLIGYLSGAYVAKVIPLMNIFFLVGRVGFFLGYPRYRTFGFITTHVPTFLAATYSLYKFGCHLGFY